MVTISLPILDYLTIGVFFIATAVTANIDTLDRIDLFVITEIKKNINELRESLQYYRSNVTVDINNFERTLREIPFPSENKTACLQNELNSARMETMMLLNMLVDGEKDELKIAEDSLTLLSRPNKANNSRRVLSELFGSLVDRGSARNKIQIEMKNYKEAVKGRYDAVKHICGV